MKNQQLQEQQINKTFNRQQLSCVYAGPKAKQQKICRHDSCEKQRKEKIALQRKPNQTEHRVNRVSNAMSNYEGKPNVNIKLC